MNFGAGINWSTPVTFGYDPFLTLIFDNAFDNELIDIFDPKRTIYAMPYTFTIVCDHSYFLAFQRFQ